MCGGVNRCLGSLKCWNGSLSRCTAAGRGTAETQAHISLGEVCLCKYVAVLCVQ